MPLSAEDTEDTPYVPYFEGGDEQVFFDISDDDWARLFSCELGETIKTPKQWAENCRRYIKENSK